MDLHTLNGAGQWLLHHGSGALFVLLALGIVGLPIPDETLLFVAGGLVSKGKLYLVPTYLSAWAGSMCGISLSYFIGYSAGHYLMVRYGRWVGLTEARLKRAHRWFERYGKWTLLIGYFLPGIRHLTGYVAGASQLSYRRFALFAYTGAIVWSTLFITFGYFSIKVMLLD